MGRSRLLKELKAMRKNPPEMIEARPLDSNILVWHYVIRGAPDTAFDGGFYHGTVKFPPQYPFKPPAISMFTESGRFKTHQRLCLSMSDFHPESWNPMWSVSTILLGLQSFMVRSLAARTAPRVYAAHVLTTLCPPRPFPPLHGARVQNTSEHTLGSIHPPTSKRQRKVLARASLASNCADRKSGKIFRELFPELAERAAAEAAAAAAAAAGSGEGGASASSGGGPIGGAAGGDRALDAATTRARRLPYILAMLCVAVAVWWALSDLR